MVRACIALDGYRRVFRKSDTGAERATVTNDSGTYVFQPEIAHLIPADVQKILSRVFKPNIH